MPCSDSTAKDYGLVSNLLFVTVPNAIKYLPSMMCFLCFIIGFALGSLFMLLLQNWNLLDRVADSSESSRLRERRVESPRITFNDSACVVKKEAPRSSGMRATFSADIISSSATGRDSQPRSSIIKDTAQSKYTPVNTKSESVSPSASVRDSHPRSAMIKDPAQSKYTPVNYKPTLSTESISPCDACRDSQPRSCIIKDPAQSMYTPVNYKPTLSTESISPCDACRDSQPRSSMTRVASQSRNRPVKSTPSNESVSSCASGRDLRPRTWFKIIPAECKTDNEGATALFPCSTSSTTGRSNSLLPQADSKTKKKARRRRAKDQDFTPPSSHGLFREEQ